MERVLGDVTMSYIMIKTKENVLSKLINFISAGMHYLIKPSHTALSQPLLQRGSQGWGGILCHLHTAVLANSTPWWWCLLDGAR